MKPSLRVLVRRRARNRCEYCQLPQSALPSAVFQIEHIIARQHGGPDEALNLALACDRCNAYKGPNISGIDPVSRQMVPLFNPRQQNWSEHFRQIGFEIVGTTAAGRATAELLNMNARRRVQLRAELRIRLGSATES